MEKFKVNDLRTWALLVSIVWSIAQFVLIYVYADLPLGADAVFVYDTQAQLCAKLGMLYPSPLNVNDFYIQAPGYVNLLVLMYVLFGSYNPVLLLQAFMNIGILYEVYYLARRFFGLRTAYISAILFCLITTNLFSAIHVGTEVPFLFFALAALCLSLNKKTYFVILAGFLYGYAHTIRSIELSFLIPSMSYYIIKKLHYKYYVALLVPFVLFLSAHGTYTMHQTGYFYTASSITGHDLLFTAYDGASGGQDHELWAKKSSPIYIENNENLHFAVKDSIWKDKALSWIKQHPAKYAYLCVKRVPMMFRNDSWSVPKFSAYDDIKEVMKMPNPNRAHLVLYLFQALYSAVFYLVCLLFLISLYMNRRDILTEKGIFVLILALGIAGTCLIGMQPRYHYPYVFVLIIWASYGVPRIWSSCKRAVADTCSKLF